MHLKILFRKSSAYGDSNIDQLYPKHQSMNALTPIIVLLKGVWLLFLDGLHEAKSQVWLVFVIEDEGEHREK